MGMSAPVMLFAALIGLALVCLYLIGLGKRWGVLVPFGLMLLVSSMAVALDYYGNPAPTIWMAIQSRRAILFLVGGAAAFGVLLVQLRSLSTSGVSVSGAMLLLIGLYGALLRFHHGGPSDGIESFVFAVVTLVPLLFATCLVGRGRQDFLAMLRTVMAVNTVWVTMCIMQFVVNPDQLTMGNENRFIGLTGNPQHAGTLMAFWVVNSLWLLLNDRGRTLRLLYIGLLGINLIMLAWTGSRTGLGMTVIGLCAVLYTRMGRAVLFLPVVLGIAYMGYKMLIGITGMDVGVERLTSMQDTRSGAWLMLYEIGSQNPILGAGTDDTERSENSWLYAFASYGIGMLGLVLALTAAAVFECLRAIRYRSWLDMPDRRMLDLCVGIVAMYFAGAVLEGYIISRVHPSMCFYIVFAGIGVAMARQAVSAKAEARYRSEESDWGSVADDEAFEAHDWDADRATAS